MHGGGQIRAVEEVSFPLNAPCSFTPKNAVLHVHVKQSNMYM